MTITQTDPEPLSPIRVLDLAIFGLNTFLAPDASDPDDTAVYEEYEEEVIDRLAVQRDLLLNLRSDNSPLGLLRALLAESDDTSDRDSDDEVEALKASLNAALHLLGLLGVNVREGAHA